MKRPGKKVATDRSFVVALSRGLDVLRAFHANDGLLGNQELAARTKLPKPTVSRLTYTLTKLGYLTPVPRFEKYQLAPSAMVVGGVGWLPGSFIGAAFTIFVPNIAEHISKGLSGAVFGVLLFLVIFLVPHGARQVAYMIEALFRRKKT